MNQIFHFIISLLERLSRKRLVIFNGEDNFSGKTAVKAKMGFWYVGDVTDSHDLAYGLLRNGLIEAEETYLVEKILKLLESEGHGPTFYDIGANTGYYGIYSAFLGKGKEQTYSFEPLKPFYDCLLESVKLNRLENCVKAFNFALGEKNEQAQIYIGGTGSSLNKNFLGDEQAPVAQVTVKQLDEVVQEHQLTAPDFIKIDVEGHELPVLLGGLKTIKESCPVLFIEIAKSLKEVGRNFVNEKFSATITTLHNLGYIIWCLEGSRLVKIDLNYNFDGVRMFLCLNETKHVALKSLVQQYSH